MGSPSGACRSIRIVSPLTIPISMNRRRNALAPLILVIVARCPGRRRWSCVVSDMNVPFPERLFHFYDDKPGDQQAQCHAISLYTQSERTIHWRNLQEGHFTTGQNV